MNATELAQHLGVSKARVSQYVSQGLLSGCFKGDGRARQFDLGRVQAALGRRLDPGQMMGNGAQTKQALKSGLPKDILVRPTPRQTDGVLGAGDLDRYELARIQSAEEDARRKRRDNEKDEGRWVLADEAQRQAARALAQEIAQFETLIREAGRAVADEFGLDFRSVRKLLMDEWRRYRADRAEALGSAAASTAMTDGEREANG